MNDCGIGEAECLVSYSSPTQFNTLKATEAISSHDAIYPTLYVLGFIIIKILPCSISFLHLLFMFTSFRISESIFVHVRSLS
jgi:hypothetical protein